MSDHRQRDEVNSWFYEMVDLGYNYRITDLQCETGSCYLYILPQWTQESTKEARFSEGLSDNLSLFDHSRSGYSLFEHIIDRTHR